MTTTDVVIVDYGLCNLDSVKRAVELCGASAECISDPSQAADASRIILPGVGSFKDAMNRLSESGWDHVLRRHVENNAPLLGICLGMQMLASSGVEGTVGNEVKGLNIIRGTVKSMQRRSPSERVPHVGWNNLIQSRSHPMWKDILAEKDFYFVHGFHFIPESEADVAGITEYCGGFVSAVAHKNVFGVQFHPEKSQKTGMQLLKNFIAWDGTSA